MGPRRRARATRTAASDNDRGLDSDSEMDFASAMASQLRPENDDKAPVETPKDGGVSGYPYYTASAGVSEPLGLPAGWKKWEGAAPDAESEWQEGQLTYQLPPSSSSSSSSSSETKLAKGAYVTLQPTARGVAIWILTKDMKGLEGRVRYPAETQKPVRFTTQVPVGYVAAGMFKASSLGKSHAMMWPVYLGGTGALLEGFDRDEAGLGTCQLTAEPQKRPYTRKGPVVWTFAAAIPQVWAMMKFRAWCTGRSVDEITRAAMNSFPRPQGWQDSQFSFDKMAAAFSQLNEAFYGAVARGDPVAYLNWPTCPWKPLSGGVYSRGGGDDDGDDDLRPEWSAIPDLGLYSRFRYEARPFSSLRRPMEMIRGAQAILNNHPKEDVTVNGILQAMDLWCYLRRKPDHGGEAINKQGSSSSSSTRAPVPLPDVPDPVAFCILFPHWIRHAEVLGLLTYPHPFRWVTTMHGNDCEYGHDDFAPSGMEEKFLDWYDQIQEHPKGGAAAATTVPMEIIPASWPGSRIPFPKGAPNTILRRSDETAKLFALDDVGNMGFPAYRPAAAAAAKGGVAKLRTRRVVVPLESLRLTSEQWVAMEGSGTEYLSVSQAHDPHQHFSRALRSGPRVSMRPRWPDVAGGIVLASGEEEEEEEAQGGIQGEIESLLAPRKMFSPEVLSRLHDRIKAFMTWFSSQPAGTPWHMTPDGLPSSTMAPPPIRDLGEYGGQVVVPTKRPVSSEDDVGRPQSGSWPAAIRKALTPARSFMDGNDQPAPAAWKEVWEMVTDGYTGGRAEVATVAEKLRAADANVCAAYRQLQIHVHNSVDPPPLYFQKMPTLAKYLEPLVDFLELAVGLPRGGDTALKERLAPMIATSAEQPRDFMAGIAPLINHVDDIKLTPVLLTMINNPLNNPWTSWYLRRAGCSLGDLRDALGVTFDWCPVPGELGNPDESLRNHEEVEPDPESDDEF